MSGSPEAVAAIERALARREVPYTIGKTWTTDAIYRETPARIAARGLFEPNEVQRLLEENRSRRVDHTHLIYALLTLEIWMQTFLDRPGVEVAS